MASPISIVNFERCYLGALLIGALNTATSWRHFQDMPAIRQAAATIGEWYLPTTTLIGYLIPILLWYFIARRASVVAKWVVVVFFAFALVGLLFNLTMGQFVTPLSAVLTVSALVLNGIAVTMLFKPDAKAWFGETPTEPDA